MIAAIVARAWMAHPRDRAMRLVAMTANGIPASDARRYSELVSGGKAEGRDPSDFDAEQLRAGTEHEMEHTDDEAVAREIAMDHLAEDPDYYRKLESLGL